MWNFGYMKNDLFCDLMVIFCIIMVIDRHKMLKEGLHMVVREINTVYLCLGVM